MGIGFLASGKKFSILQFNPYLKKKIERHENLKLISRIQKLFQMVFVSQTVQVIY